MGPSSAPDWGLVDATDVILLRTEGNLVAQFRNVMIQVRSGPMTAAVLDRIESDARLLRAATTGPVGAIAIMEEGAELAAPSLRMRQVAVIRELLSDRRTHFAAVVVGDGVATRAVRTVMRMALLGVPRINLAATAEQAVDWLCERLGKPPRSELMDAVRRARAAASHGTDD